MVLLRNYVQLESTDVTISNQYSRQNYSLRNNPDHTKNYTDQGTRIARVAVMTNVHIDNIHSDSKNTNNMNIRMPVNIDKAGHLLMKRKFSLR